MSTFDERLLPQWARENPAVRALCQHDRLYRRGVIAYGRDKGWRTVFEAWARQWGRGERPTEARRLLEEMEQACPGCGEPFDGVACERCGYPDNPD